MPTLGIEFAVSLSDKNFVLPDGAERPAFISGRLSLLDHDARDARLRRPGAYKSAGNRKTNDQRFREEVKRNKWCVHTLSLLELFICARFLPPRSGLMILAVGLWSLNIKYNQWRLSGAPASRGQARGREPARGTRAHRLVAFISQ